MCTFHSMEKTVHSDLRLIKMPTRTWTRFQMMSYRLMLHKTSLNKTGKADGDETVVAPLAERMRLHELSMLQHPMDHVTCDETSTKQSILLLAAR